jgi:hypothetical protein
MVRIRFNACIRTIVVLIGGKLIGIYFMYLLSAIYFLQRRTYAKVRR